MTFQKIEASRLADVARRQADTLFAQHPLTMHAREAFEACCAAIASLAALATPVEPCDHQDFIVRTNADYIAWCKIFYEPSVLDERGMMSLHGLWAWQERDRRAAAAASQPVQACPDGGLAFCAGTKPVIEYIEPGPLQWDDEESVPPAQKELSDDDLRRIARAVGMLPSHDGVTMRSVGHAGGMTAEDGFKFGRACVLADRASRAPQGVQADAERYRWIMKNCGFESETRAIQLRFVFEPQIQFFRELEAAIDAARAQDRDGMSTPTVAECLAQLDTWNGRLEAAIDAAAHAALAPSEGGGA